MNNEVKQSREDPFYAVYPPDPTPGSLGVLVRQSRFEELGKLEKERQFRIWKVRGVVSDHIPLSGDPNEIISDPIRQHQFYLNENPLVIYLQPGGVRAVYYDLVANEEGRLKYIEVQVGTDMPSNAFLLARKPLNELLDTMLRMVEMPLLYERLELISPRDGEPIAYEMVLPYTEGIKLGPLGGIGQWPPFAPYEAIFREAVISSSPFYRLLCACRVYEGTNSLRRWMKEQCARFGILERLPGDPQIDPKDFGNLQLAPEVLTKVKNSADLFNNVLRDHRDAIAHFLFKGGKGQSHVYLADGATVRTYAMGGAVLLKYARQAINELKMFYIKHLEEKFMRGSVLPMPENRDQFIVMDPRFIKKPIP